jgi:hypothetical protein
MLLRNRVPGIDQRPATTTQGFEHLPDTAIAVLRWLAANRVDFVLVGPVARAVRGDMTARGPIAIVPAPYGRNLDRLARALWAAHARLRVDVGAPGVSSGADTVPIKMTADKLVRSERWTLRCGIHDLDVEGRPAGVPRYQELLYEAARFGLAEDVSVEVAAPEDIEHYDHVRRTGASPEMKLTRAVREPDGPST